jgi:hypothetical protein
MTDKKMKGLVVSATSLLIFFACFIMVGTGLAGAVSLSVNPALTEDLAPTDTFSVDVVVDSAGTALSGIDFSLTYDTSALDVTGATYSGLLDGMYFVNLNDGEVLLAALDNSPYTSHAGTVLTIDFEVKEGAADGMYDLELDGVTLQDGSLEDISPVTINDGQVEVEAESSGGEEEVPVLEIIADTGVFGVGDTFQATVVVDSAETALSGLDFSMAYDTSALDVTSATYSGLLDGMYFVNLNDGEVLLAALDTSPYASQVGTVLTIDFEVKEGAPDGFYTLDLTDVTLEDGDENPITDVDVIDDIVEIETPVEVVIEGIDLLPGWNLISVPETLENADVDFVLQDFSDTEVDSVFYYNASSGMMEIPEDFEPLKAYWVHNDMGETVTINETYLVPMVPSVPPMLTLYPGWNAIGHTAMVELSAEVALSTIDDCYDKVVGPWLPATSEYAYWGHNLEEVSVNGNHVLTDEFAMNVYEGYFVYVDEECVLA